MADFQCMACGCHIEHFFHTIPDSIACEGCDAIASRVFTMPGELTPRDAAPTTHVVHRGANGQLRFPGHPDAPVPKGFVKEEISGFAEVRRFEKEVNHQEYRRFAALEEGRERAFSARQSESRRQLRSELKTEYGKDLARLAVDKSNQAPRRKFEAGFTVESLSYNKNNHG